jgi:hypothetical protein
MKRALLSEIRSGKKIVVRTGNVADGLEVETVLRAVREKIDAIDSNLARSAAVVGRLEARLGEAS